MDCIDFDRIESLLILNMVSNTSTSHALTDATSYNASSLDSGHFAWKIRYCIS